jgi:GT2 family glycosyltransferase
MLAQTYQGTIEFLFIDGGSTDGSREIVSELARRNPHVRLLDNPGQTTPQALNLGLRVATGEFVVRMDAHSRYPATYVANGIARLRRGDVAAVSGAQLAVGDGKWSRRAALALTSPLGVGGAKFRRLSTDETEVDSGFTGLWRRETLLAHDGWDDDWVGDEDFELAARLREAGGRIVCLPEMAAEYSPRDSLTALARQYWAYGRARVRTSRRHAHSMRPSHVLPPALVLTLVAATLGPRPLARPGRAGMLVYAAALSVESMRALARGAEVADAAALPGVFATMHVAFGAGALTESGTNGIPVAALLQALLRLGRRVTRLDARA